MTSSTDSVMGRLLFIEFWVGNAFAFSYFLRKGYGFSQIAYSGPETGLMDRVTYALRQGEILLLVTGPTSASSEVARFVHHHGDSVRDVAFAVSDVDVCTRDAIERGARRPISFVATGEGDCALQTFGDVIHTILPTGWTLEASDRKFRPAKIEEATASFTSIDHIVGNVPTGQMSQWREFYARTLGLVPYQTFTNRDVRTERTSLQSEVLYAGGSGLKININEPGTGKLKSHIQEYLDCHGGAGVQHIALTTTDILHSVRQLRANGVPFLNFDASYYDELPECPHKITENLPDLKRSGILIDWDDNGYLLQNFALPLTDRPTVFFELIQRKGARTFGRRTFNTLFKAMEEAQLARGYR